MLHGALKYGAQQGARRGSEERCCDAQVSGTLQYRIARVALKPQQ